MKKNRQILVLAALLFSFLCFPKENYTYDRSSYIIAVYIKNGENGKLVPQVIAEKNDGKKCGELMFYNSYNKRNI